MVRGREQPFTIISSWLGIISPFVILAVILYATAIAPWFSWPGNALSDLGTYPGTALLFNRRTHQRSEALISLILGIVAIIIWPWPWRGVAVPEFVSAVALSTWIVYFTAKSLAKVYGPALNTSSS